MAPEKLTKLMAKLEKQMFEHAKNLEFEQAAATRDQITDIEAEIFGIRR